MPNGGVLILLRTGRLGLARLSENRLAAVCFATDFGTAALMLSGKSNRNELDYSFESYVQAHQITANAVMLDGSWFA